LTVRAANVLANLGCKTFADVTVTSLRDLRRYRNCGRKTVADIDRLVKLVGDSLEGRA
jgi:DNA-directed RNA polymerase alpha subunit